MATPTHLQPFSHGVQHDKRTVESYIEIDFFTIFVLADLLNHQLVKFKSVNLTQ